MEESIELLFDPQNPSAPMAGVTFERVLREIESARTSIEIHMYVWRSDATGHRVGSALLQAAQRGVTIRIKKDTGAIMYEHIEMNRKSFLHTDLPFFKKLTYRLLRPTFPNTYVEDEYDGELGIRLVSHPNVTLEWVQKTHTKYYLFDEARLILGSINIEDRHWGYLDYMVALEGTELISRFRSRTSGHSDYDSQRDTEFICNNHHPDGSRTFDIKPILLQSLDNVRETLYIEMAYLGDEEVTASIIRAAKRGVEVTILFSENANIGNDINFLTIYKIASQSPASVYLSTAMIHSKLMLFDGEEVQFGSCNLSVFSLQKAGEINLSIKGNSRFLDAVNSVINARLAAARKVKDPEELKTYRPLIAALQQLHQKCNPN